MRVLVLGGTADARTLAAELHARRGCLVISSLAGRIAQPVLPEGQVRIGGFGGVDGLTRYLREEAIDVLVDATHPFAQQISEHAADSAEAAGVRLIALRRPGWAAEPGDRWTHVADVAEAAGHAAAAPDGDCVFVTTGKQDLNRYAADVAPHHYVIRTIDPPSGPLPPDHTLVLARGPFTVDGESALMEQHDVRMLVTKNSGGASSAAKLAAARSRAIPVIMVEPPAPLAAAETAETAAAALALLFGSGSGL